MNRQDLRRSLKRLSEGEICSIPLDFNARYRVAMAYPNTYFVGMSNLGMQIIYKEINGRADSSAERVFLPADKEEAAYVRTGTPLMSVETGRPLHDFDVIGIAVTYEMDYFNIPKLLRMGKVPVRAENRRERDAYVIAGGPCATFNPEPFSDFVDACIVGEGEGVIGEVLDAIYDGRERRLPRREVLKALSRIAGVYVPSLYRFVYDGMKIKSAEPCEDAADAPKRVVRQRRALTEPGETVIATDDTEFGAMYLVEVARGCGRHCRFCMAGYCYRTPRIRPLEELKGGVDRAGALGKKVGLMGAAISDYPYIDELVRYIRAKGLRFSCASLRADSVTDDIVNGLAESGQRTVTLAPEAGSERLRRVINKGLDEEDLRRAVVRAAAAGIRNLRLYIMIGLPTETDEDVQAIVDMAIRAVRHLETLGMNGRLTLSINPFVPKPFTPFQRLPMADRRDIKRKLKSIRQALKPETRIEILAESSKESYVQAVLARGDRRLGRVIEQAERAGGHAHFDRACIEERYDAETALYHERDEDEILPWIFLDMGLKEGYLEAERRAGEEERYTFPCAQGCRRCGVCDDTCEYGG